MPSESNPPRWRSGLAVRRRDRAPQPIAAEAADVIDITDAAGSSAAADQSDADLDAARDRDVAGDAAGDVAGDGAGDVSGDVAQNESARKSVARAVSAERAPRLPADDDPVLIAPYPAASPVRSTSRSTQGRRRAPSTPRRRGSAPVELPERRTAGPDERGSDDYAFAERPLDTRAAEEERRALFAALLADDPLVDEESEPPEGPPPFVTVVLVAHDGEEWLPETLAALAAQTRVPEQVIAVDTGSTDTTPRLLTRALGTTRLVTLPRSTGYGTAIAAALTAQEVPATARQERREWLWLLHDDSAPDPNALERLLSHAARNPSVSVLGAKAVDWHHPDRLVEIGLTTDGAGRRETGLDVYELDQGQHEQPRDVLAVGTAGALIRRETWDALAGMDGALPLLREDIDFGWRAVRSGRRVVVVPAARIRHARATLTGHRRLDALPGHLRRYDRAHGLYVLLANSGRFGGLLGLPRLVVGVLVRALMLLLTRRPRQALDEVAAGFAILVRPGRIVAARRWRRPQVRLPASAVRPLLARRSARLRATFLATTDRLAAGGEFAARATTDDDELPDDDVALLRRLLLRPVFALIAVLTVLAVVADRHLFGAGALTGGRLLPVDSGATGLWRSYLASFHATGTGGSTAAPPWEPILAALSLPFGGKPAAALTVLVLGAVPLAGLSAWWGTRRLGLPTGLRLWAASTYALLPPISGAVAGGRFDAIVALIVMPLLIASGVRLFTDPGGGQWNRAFALGLGLALTTAFSPPVWVLAAVLLGGAGLLGLVTARGGGHVVSVRRLSTAAVALAVPVVVLVPWTFTVLRYPRMLLVGLGISGNLAGAAGRAPGAADLLLLNPGGHALAPLWVGAPLLLATVVGVSRRRSGRRALAAVGVALAGMALGLASARTGAGASGGTPDGWAGLGLGVASCGLLAAALIGAAGARPALRAITFGPRQPLAVLAGLLAALVPIVAGVWLVTHPPTGPMVRSTGSALPQFVLDDARLNVGERILWLQNDNGTVGYALQSLGGAHLGDEEVRQAPAAQTLLAALVADIASDRGTDAAETLATFNVRYVAVAQSSAGTIPLALDTQPALSRYAVPGNVLLWQLLVPATRAELLAGPLVNQAESSTQPTEPLGRGPVAADISPTTYTALPSGAVGVHTSITAAATPRLLVLSDSANSRWRASLDGTPLPRTTAWGWAQAFVVPADEGGTLTVRFPQGARHGWLWVQFAVIVLALVLGAPSVRRADGRDPSLDDDEAAEAAAEAGAAQHESAFALDEPVEAHP